MERETEFYLHSDLRDLQKILDEFGVDYTITETTDRPINAYVVKYCVDDSKYEDIVRCYVSKKRRLSD